MNFLRLISTVLPLLLLSSCAATGAGRAPASPESVGSTKTVETEMEGNYMNYRTEELWCRNGDKDIYGVAYIPRGEGVFPLVIFSHELGNSHTSGIRYAERLAEGGYAAYVFDFCGGNAPGTESRSDGTNAELSVMTEASDLESVLANAKGWAFVDASRIFLLGGSMGGLVTAVVGCEHQSEIAGMILMYPALSIKEDSEFSSYPSPKDVPPDISLFGGWMHVGSNFITDIWDINFYELLSGYQNKLLLLHGDRDTTVALSYSEKAAELISDCEFHVIANGGHEFYNQPFEDAIGYILPYLASQLERSGSFAETQAPLLHMKIGDTPIEVQWEENGSVSALMALAKGGLTIQMSMYGEFEQVGPIGTSLPRDDVQTTTSAGDIVLYSGNQIVVFYGSNSWAYTRLGKITNQSAEELKQLLGNGDATLVLSTAEQ